MHMMEKIRKTRRREKKTNLNRNAILKSKNEKDECEIQYTFNIPNISDITFPPFVFVLPFDSIVKKSNVDSMEHI